MFAYVPEVNMTSLLFAYVPEVNMTSLLYWAR